MKASFVSWPRAPLAACVIALPLAGCGLAETSAVAASEAAAAAEQIKQGRELQEKVQRDIDAAQQAAADARTKAEAGNE